MKIINIPVTVDASGDGTGTSAHVQGYLYAVQLIDGNFADGVDIDIDCVNDELSYILLDKDNFNSDQIVFPRTLEHLNTDGTNLATHCESLVFGKILVTVAAGGVSTSGSFRFFVREFD